MSEAFLITETMEAFSNLHATVSPICAKKLRRPMATMYEMLIVSVGNLR